MKKRLATIEAFLKKASVVVTASNAGQMLVAEVIDYFGYHGQVMRLLLKEKHLASVKKFAASMSMKNNAKCRNFYLEELCRSRANWLIGKNMSRAVTKLLAHDKLVPIGRIQTPMLALIVRRGMDIESEAERPININTTCTTRNALCSAKCSGLSDAEPMTSTVLKPGVLSRFTAERIQ